MTIALDVVAVSADARGPLAAAPAVRPRIPSRVLALARIRLVQFAALGGLIFALAPRTRNPRNIALRSDRAAAFAAFDAARRGGPPRAREDVQEEQLEDELLYREALRLGLDKTDGIVRARLVQKSLFLAEELAGASRPATEAELRAFFEQNRERWPRSARFEEVRRSVIAAHDLFRRQEAIARFLESAFARYRVTLDGRPVTAISPARRAAYRPAASGED
jgi:hypothetical protein